MIPLQTPQTSPVDPIILHTLLLPWSMVACLLLHCCTRAAQPFLLSMCRPSMSPLRTIQGITFAPPANHVPSARLQVPPLGKGALYLRPLLMGTGPILGLGPAPSYTFTIFGAAVGAYFKVQPQACTLVLVNEARQPESLAGGRMPASPIAWQMKCHRCAMLCSTR
jgi:hypothetical protein